MRIRNSERKIHRAEALATAHGGERARENFSSRVRRPLRFIRVSR